MRAMHLKLSPDKSTNSFLLEPKICTTILKKEARRHPLLFSTYLTLFLGLSLPPFK